MTVEGAVIVIGGSILLLVAMIALMRRANQVERRSMERRRQEWIDAGRLPGDEPNFYSGSGDSPSLKELVQPGSSRWDYHRVAAIFRRSGR